MNRWRSLGVVLGLILSSTVLAEEIEILALDIISYEDFIQQDPNSLQTLHNALLEKGIVGIRGVPGYKEKVFKFIEAAQGFSALSEEAKEAYAPKTEETFLGYERGKEKFQRPDGSWVIDDLKISYYAFVPETPFNKWPDEIDLQTPFQDLGNVMCQTGLAVMQAIGLLNYQDGICLDEEPRLGRMLYYKKSQNTVDGNPFWCGAHYDHSLFTTLLPAFYFSNGEMIPEPIEAGLFVKSIADGVFRKVIANDPDVLMFQVGEFGQLVSNDVIRATEHRVHKADGNVERYTMALFCNPPMDTVIHSTSVLTQDSRYGAESGEACSYQHWNDETFKRFHVDKSQ